MSNALLRILTALVGIPLVLGITYLGGWPFILLVMLAALLAQYEVYKMLEAAGARPYLVAGMLMGVLVGIRTLFEVALPIALVVFLVLLAVMPFVSTEREPLRDLSGTIFGVLYPTFLLTYLIDLRTLRGPDVGDLEAFYLTLTLFLLIWSADTFAYFTGKNLGKRPLAPAVSPKKTWEGSLGGAVGTFLVAVILKSTLLPFLSWPDVLVLAVIGGIISQLGDLAESALKRSAGVKDSGAILPGHGGLLDRFDAMILAVPLIVLYLTHIAKVYY